MRKLKKQPVGPYNAWDNDLEPGMRVWEPVPSKCGAWMIDIKESNGRNKRDSGELTPYYVKKHGSRRIAVMSDDDGYWYWKN